ncbi:hypothetical protein HF086_009533 [Spodoptera exigua]|uniref:Uncharacterized protein n=1 Tax=Spodoptera exigua TaxID=7107 RepID=A0A922SFN5_SPOEX|nr:hypothetical protein HF086_009533 [Spodoptera exigua]
MAPRLTALEREHIIALRQSGCRIVDISRLTGITKRTIYLWIRRWEEDGSLQPHHRKVYKRATTAEQDAAIVAAHASDPLMSTRVSSTSYNVKSKENNDSPSVPLFGTRVGRNEEDVAPPTNGCHGAASQAGGSGYWRQGDGGGTGPEGGGEEKRGPERG